MKKLILVLFCVGCATRNPLPSAFQEKPELREADDNFNGYIVTDPGRHALSTARVKFQLEKMNDDLRWEFKLKEFRTILRGFKSDMRETKQSSCRVTIYDFEKHEKMPKDKILIEVLIEDDSKEKHPNPPKFTFGSTEDVKMLDDPEDTAGGWRVYQTRHFVPDGGDGVKWLYVNSLPDQRSLRVAEGTFVPGKVTPRNMELTCEHLR